MFLDFIYNLISSVEREQRKAINFTHSFIDEVYVYSYIR